MLYNDTFIPGYEDTWIHEYKDMRISEYIYTRIQGYVKTWMHEYKNMRRHEYMDTWICEYMNTWIHEYQDRRICEYMYTWIHEYKDTRIWADPDLPHTDFPEKEIKCMWNYLSLFIVFIVHGCIGQVVEWIGLLFPSADSHKLWQSLCLIPALHSNFAFPGVFGHFLLPIGILFCHMFFFDFYLEWRLLFNEN